MENGDEKSLRRYTNSMSALDVLLNKHIVLTTTSGWADTNDNLSIERYRKAVKHESVVAICLTGSYETFHHFHVFASGQNGLYIQFNREKFVNAMNADSRLLHGSVRYLSFNDIRGVERVPIDEVPFIKRSGFKDENEYRVLMRSHDPKCKSESIPITIDVIEKVVFSPFVPSPLVESFKRIVKLIEGCEKLVIGQSRLTNNQQWLKQIDRLLK